MNHFLFWGVFWSFIILAMGLLARKFPSQYGTNTGINTPRSRKSREHWEYAQRYGPRYFIRYGIVALIANILITMFAIWVPRLQLPASILEILICFSCVILAFIKVENMLKEFDKNQKSNI
jgi:hypothetical protein